MEKKRIQGNQPLELTEFDKLLSVALDCHFSNSNCGGVLLYVGIIIDQCDGNLPVSIYQFVCKKCHEVIQI